MLNAQMLKKEHTHTCSHQSYHICTQMTFWFLVEISTHSLGGSNHFKVGGR